MIKRFLLLISIILFSNSDAMLTSITRNTGRMSMVNTMCRGLSKVSCNNKGSVVNTLLNNPALIRGGKVAACLGGAALSLTAFEKTCAYLGSTKIGASIYNGIVETAGLDNNHFEKTFTQWCKWCASTFLFPFTLIPTGARGITKVINLLAPSLTVGIATYAITDDPESGISAGTGFGVIQPFIAMAADCCRYD